VDSDVLRERQYKINHIQFHVLSFFPCFPFLTFFPFSDIIILLKLKNERILADGCKKNQVEEKRPLV